MSVYRQRYEDWFNNLTDTEREAETARLNSNKSTRKPAAVKIKQEPKSVVNMNQPQQQPQQLLANLVNFWFLIHNLEVWLTIIRLKDQFLGSLDLEILNELYLLGV